MQKRPLDFSIDDKNGKEMEEGKSRRKNLPGDQFNNKGEGKSYHSSVMKLRKEKNCIGFGECPNGYCLWAEGENDNKRKEKISGLEMKMYNPYIHINCD